MTGSVADGAKAYRVEWWVPVVADPGEWAGRWRLVTGVAAARDAALAVLRSDVALGLVRVTRLPADGRPETAAALDAAELEAWDTADEGPPVGARVVGVLPPRGRDDVECETLLSCRDALLAAHAVGLVHRAVVTAVLNIVQQAFAGTGPAIEMAVVVSPDVVAPNRSRAS